MIGQYPMHAFTNVVRRLNPGRHRGGIPHDGHSAPVARRKPLALSRNPDSVRLHHSKSTSRSYERREAFAPETLR